MSINEEILKEIDKSYYIALFCHTKPDADTVGSAMALRYFLEEKGKKVEVFCDSEIQSSLDYLKKIELIKKNYSGCFDLHIALDCGDRYRFGELTESFFSCKNTVNIDHHELTNDGFAKLNRVEKRASTCEMIYELIVEAGGKIDKDKAYALMSGILTDTNSFSNSNTDEKVLMTASKLVGMVDINKLNFVLLKSMSYEYLKLTGKALSRLRRYFDGKMTLIYVLEKEYTEAGVPRNEIKGLVEYALKDKDTKIAVSICQAQENKFEISFRSKDNVDVCKVCRVFGGGGHRVASGCVINGFFEDVVDKIVRAVELEQVLND